MVSTYLLPCVHLSRLDGLSEKAAEILTQMCTRASSSVERPLLAGEFVLAETSNWMLKANVTVFRHADRTPKQKLKFNFPIDEAWTQPFVQLLHGETDEIILREKSDLHMVATAVEESKKLGANGDHLAKLSQLSSALERKIELPGTKAQLKPVYSKKKAGKERTLTKLTLVFKWGGEVRVSFAEDIHILTTLCQFTHSARYQSRDLGEFMKKDIGIISKCIRSYEQSMLNRVDRQRVSEQRDRR
jgi:inositol hexakisphosphate/diphosphoinositol-pentakisphosphate kinase